ncbi:hypothetical protein IW262DRAFT_1383338 [Armillaria fumosa]|nr:hypothetical protein IW262DRAFT_1383338 [Armillaria fumosa]
MCIIHTGTPNIPKDLWLPKSYHDLQSVPEDQIIDKLDPSHPLAKCFRVISPSPGIIIKFGNELSDEVVTQRFARDKLGAIVPRVLYHPPLLFTDTEDTPTAPLAEIEPKGCWYMAMERCPGVALRDIIETMSPSELDHIAEQLKSFLAHMETITSPMNTMGSVTGGPYRNSFWPDGLAPEKPFTTLEEFVGYYGWMILFGQCTEA